MLAEDLLEDAERLRRKLWEPTVVYSFGGSANTYAEEHVSEPPPADKRALMATAATAIDRSLKLVPAEASSDLDSAKSMLGSLGEALARYSREEDERDASEAEQAGEG